MKKAPVPTEVYYPTEIVCACRECHVVGELEFPAGFDFRTGDRLMDRKTITGYCVRCKKTTEFIPAPIQNLNDDGHKLLDKLEKDRLKSKGIYIIGRHTPEEKPEQ